MRQAFLFVTLLTVPALAGCGSSSAEKAKDSDSKRASAAEQALNAFYAAANDANGKRACGYLTDQGVRRIVRVGWSAACVRMISGFDKGSFAHGEGELVDVEHVEASAGAVEVEAEVKGRSGGTYRLVERGRKLRIDSFESKEK